jgi:hypothetical protein
LGEFGAGGVGGFFTQALESGERGVAEFGESEPDGAG